MVYETKWGEKTITNVYVPMKKTNLALTTEQNNNRRTSTPTLNNRPHNCYIEEHVGNGYYVCDRRQLYETIQTFLASILKISK